MVFKLSSVIIEFIYLKKFKLTMSGSLIQLTKALSLLIFISFRLASASEPSFQETMVDVDYAEFVLHIWQPKAGNFETVFALPGSGADVSRYKYIGPLLAQAGYKLIAVNQRGISGSTGNLEQLTLRDLADDIIAIADRLKIRKFHMTGWAFGNRTSRMLATLYPTRLKSLIIIAAGGIVPALTQPGELALLLDDQSLSEKKKIYLARRTMFSPATDEKIIREYVSELTYWPEARVGQRRANQNTPVEDWIAGGNGPILMIMGVDDLTAPIENGYLMKAAHNDRLTLVPLEKTGHAVGLEKPELVAKSMIQFLRKNSIR